MRGRVHAFNFAASNQDLDMVFGLFKKKKDKENKNGDSRYHQLTIQEVVPIAKDAVNLVFEAPGSDFDYQPGQFITLIQEVNGKKIRRAYSLCSTPFEDANPAVTVKRVPDGQMSNHVNDVLKAGDEVEIMEPMGLFTTTYDPAAMRNIVFFGGGSGITPLYSLIRSVLLKEPNSTLSLVYGNRSEEYIIFKDELHELASTYADRFNLIHILEEGEADYVGRPTKDTIAEIAGKLEMDASTEVFICGPQPMMDVVTDGLKQAGIADEQVRMESFEAGKTSPAEIIAEESEAESSSEVSILLEGENYSITVPKQRAVLEVGLEDGLDMPYSCQSGLCTACRGKCLEGEISIDGAEGLTQDEIDEGYVLLCVGKPLTDQVKVEIG